MGIIAINVNTTGLTGSSVTPRRCTLVTTDNLATVTGAGYLNNQNLLGNTILPTDIFEMLYSFNEATQVGIYGIFQVTYSSATGFTLNLWENPGNVLLPVVSGDFAVFNGTSGQIKDAGYLPSDAAKTVVVMAGGAVVANHIALFQDTTGTIDDTAAIAINNGSIQAGLSGTAGTLISFPSTAANGSLILAGVNAGGAFNTTISNGTMGQATVYTIPDVGASTGQFLAKTAALVSGNVIVASGTAGKVVDGGFAVKANTTAAYGGGGTSNAFTATGLTTSSIVTAIILTSTNSVSITKAVPTANTLTVTFSADPGAATTVSWIAITPAV